MSTEHSLKSLAELEVQINNRIRDFNNKRVKNQNKNNHFTVVQIVSSAVTTLLIAVNAEKSIFLVTVIALITSLVASVSGQFLSKFMYRERMAMNIETVCSLYELRHTITMDKKKEEDDGESHKITLEKVDSYQNQYQKILNSANGQWQKYIQKTNTIEK